MDENITKEDIDRVYAYLVRHFEKGEQIETVEIMVGIGMTKEKIGEIAKILREKGKISYWFPPKDGCIEF